MSRTKDLSGYSGQRHMHGSNSSNELSTGMRRFPVAHGGISVPTTPDLARSCDLPRCRRTGCLRQRRAQLQDLFDTSRLIVNGTIVMANAYLAASLVFQDQIIGSGQQILEYPKLAQMYRGMWEDQFDSCLIEFDTTNAVPASNSIIQVDRDIVYLT